jgi:hypothetical protein
MWYWWVSGILCWLMSAACIISTIVELKMGKVSPRGPKAVDFWGAVAFHGITAILALWLIAKALAH